MNGYFLIYVFNIGFNDLWCFSLYKKIKQQHFLKKNSLYIHGDIQCLSGICSGESSKAVQHTRAFLACSLPQMCLQATERKTGEVGPEHSSTLWTINLLKSGHPEVIS